METEKRAAVPLVAAVHDLSGFGRCSLTVAIPILSAMGMQVCPFPTAILSNHTGYPQYFWEDLADRMPAYMQGWEKLGLSFQAIYTGFLGGVEQVDTLLDFFDRFPAPIRLVDPVMADDGQLYATCCDELCTSMKRLVARGTVTTPNLTEACLLTGRDYHTLKSRSGEAYWREMEAIAHEVAALGPQQVVITGISDGKGQLYNLVTDHDAGETFRIAVSAVEKSFAGTGDVFASVLCGCLVRGIPLRTAVEKTAAYVRKVTAFTYAQGMPYLDGIAFEPFLSELAAL